MKLRFLIVPFAMATSLVPNGMGFPLHKTEPSPFSNQSKPMTAKVRILALSSSSRQSFAGNQEIYLADIQVKDGEHSFARLIDQYPGFGLGIRTAVLREQTLLTMKVTREPECDVPAARIYLPQGNDVTFDGSVRSSLATHRDEPVPCFRSIHQTIRIARLR